MVGNSNESLCGAVNAVIAHQGGLAVWTDATHDCLPLPVAGLMAAESCEATAAAYRRLTVMARELGSSLAAPFMTLSFMALPVIPSLKLTDRGLFDVDRFEFVSPWN